jgi:hypothetical protein
LENVSHTLDVTATTLYEAVALGLAALRDTDWGAGIPKGLAAVRVSVTGIPIEAHRQDARFHELGGAERREPEGGE